jgi:hypothetical protein
VNLLALIPALIQPYDKAVAGEEFQVWKLKVREDHTATLSCEDGNGHTVFSKEMGSGEQRNRESS